MDAVFIINQAFNGLSLASILLLAALGLALSFGLMRVINMAHGEMLMLGGVVAYLVQQTVPKSVSLWIALPVAFIATALLGILLETTIIRWLYGRPLDTLLATWGISLILQQAVVLWQPFGVSFVTPGWLSGQFSIQSGAFAGVTLPYVRIFVIILSILVMLGLASLLRYTRIGLYVRAVNQSRDMASALGVNTRMVDMAVFALGTGLAGLAGAALATISPITGVIGSSYIINAFLVVILGGVGSIWGALLAAVSLGFFTSFFESFYSVSYAKVIILLLVIAFLQWRPKGFIVTRSRALEETA
ncbi:MAG: urea ABC transporter permease subunit UrtB [Trueperaceae bacterium]|nr:urea ABC transporter permease subunit UrtB [Trueperaceae bacterium]